MNTPRVNAYLKYPIDTKKSQRETERMKEKNSLRYNTQEIERERENSVQNHESRLGLKIPYLCAHRPLRKGKWV